MKCPFCDSDETYVVETRETRDDVTRRRRECVKCNKRFTTYERIEELFPLIIKKDGRREAYEHTKVLGGMRTACEKRNISNATLEKLADEIEIKLQEMDKKELPSAVIGELVMEKLRKIDKVAYIRFASVYRAFKDIGEFMEAVRDVNKDEKD